MRLVHMPYSLRNGDGRRHRSPRPAQLWGTPGPLPSPAARRANWHATASGSSFFTVTGGESSHAWVHRGPVSLNPA